MPVSVRATMTLKACELDSDFKEKSVRAREGVMRHFIASHDIVLCMKTNESQRKPAEVIAEALDWLESIRPRLTGPEHDKNYIINMDQTPVFFTMNPKCTLHLQKCIWVLTGDKLCRIQNGCQRVLPQYEFTGKDCS